MPGASKGSCWTASCLQGGAACRKPLEGSGRGGVGDWRRRRGIEARSRRGSPLGRELGQGSSSRFQRRAKRGSRTVPNSLHCDPLQPGRLQHWDPPSPPLFVWKQLELWPRPQPQKRETQRQRRCSLSPAIVVPGPPAKGRKELGASGPVRGSGRAVHRLMALLLCGPQVGCQGVVRRPRDSALSLSCDTGPCARAIPGDSRSPEP